MLLLAGVARAAVAPAALNDVEVAPPADARIPLDSVWHDETGAAVTLGQAARGQPALVIFADYTCSSLCGPILGFVSDALVQSHLPLAGFRLVVLGLDPTDSPEDAERMRRDRIADHRIASVTTFLRSDERTIRITAAALGYRFTYDPEHDQFAHPAAVFVVAASGRVARVLSALGITPDDLRLALTDAGQGKLGSITDHLRLLCYGFDPTVGAYTLPIQRLLLLLGSLTALILASAILWMGLAPRRASKTAGPGTPGCRTDRTLPGEPECLAARTPKKTAGQ